MRLRDILVVLITLSSCSAAWADTATVFVPAEAGYDRYGKFSESIKTQCDTARVISAAVVEYNANAKLSRTPQNETRYLEILVNHLAGGRTRGFIIGVRGRLFESGEVKGTFAGSRSSALDPFAYMGTGPGGTCGLVGLIAKRVGRDIAEFLTHPSVQAKIGDP